MPVDPVRLRATLGDPALARLLEALRRRIELGRPLTGMLTLASASEAERRVLDGLLGRPSSRGGSFRVNLDLLAESLALAGVSDSLREAVEALLGPVRERREDEADQRRAWLSTRSLAGSALAPWPPLGPWLDKMFASGVLKRLAPTPREAARLIDDVAKLARTLPAAGEPLAALAARLHGDAHALDSGSPRATLAVRAAALLGGVPFENDAEGRREAWASVGVLCDELSAPALVFNLPAAGDTPPARMLRTARAEGEPLHMTLRQLLLWPLSGDPALADLEVFVCENPTIVALAVRRLGGRCAPLVCVNGQFATTVKILLRQLASAGARLRYHGDFDIGGLAIARRVICGHGATPWRMGCDDYLGAPPGKSLGRDKVPDTPWAPGLAVALRERRHAVHEEVVAESLLDDLGASKKPTES